ncbi:nucleoside deaminase [Neobacillus niacini]|uniref:nucleoside deaminase n=1 Tax=Neobacillus niacini TaxID=86668 RepID=UPI0028621CDF|nr:guanine deaminase [Neobacillus niacini]
MESGGITIDNLFIKAAVDIALNNVLTNSGGPFGAVIVKNGTVISTGRNQVVAGKDPTAHAEVQAIRAACLHLNSYKLTDCEIYTNCKPCPMCLGAIYWSKLKAVYYANTSEDAAQIGFNDQFIYEQLCLPKNQRTIPMTQILTQNYQQPFQAWQHTSAKTHY